jgi:hypothetical protein
VSWCRLPRAFPINERRLYVKRDEGPLGANGIQARVSSYPALFVREDGLVKLREAAPSANGESA